MDKLKENSSLNFLKLTRPKNLIIVALTQLFFQFVIIAPAFKSAEIPLALNPINLGLLVLCTIFITAGGNVINDFFDAEIDTYNKPKTHVSVLNHGQILKTYFAIVLIGAIIAFYVAFTIDNLKLFSIYPAAVILLFLYSYRFKHLPLVGNIIVALFTALVIFILLFAERIGIGQMIQNNLAEANNLKACSIGFMTFAFLSNFAREIVKDIEDIEGDRKFNSLTLPIFTSIKTAKIVGSAILVLLLIALLAWPMIDGAIQLFHWNRAYLRIILTLPVFYFLNKLYRAESKAHYHQLSQELKWYMVAGLLYLPFYYLQ